MKKISHAVLAASIILSSVGFAAIPASAQPTGGLFGGKTPKPDMCGPCATGTKGSPSYCEALCIKSRD